MGKSLRKCTALTYICTVANEPKGELAYLLVETNYPDFRKFMAVSFNMSNSITYEGY